MPELTETGVDVYYLAFGDEDDEERNQLLRELRHRIRFEVDYAPTQDDFDMLWEHVGHDPDATLDNIFPRWNAGSGQESEAFARRECQDCDAVFVGNQEPGDYGRAESPINLSVRQNRAETHEKATRTDPTDPDSGHTVGRSTRSLSVGDVVVADGTAHVVAGIGFEVWDHIEVDG